MSDGLSTDAQMITAADPTDPAPLFRTTLTLDPGHGDVRSARLRASAYGVFEARIDGQPVSEAVLSPGWSSYEWRLRHTDDDVTALVRDGAVLGFAVGNGWARGRLGSRGLKDVYSDRLGVIADLEVEFADGHRQHLVTGEGWESGPSRTLANDLYDGQHIDTRRRPADPWADPDGWQPATTMAFDHALLTPYLGPQVRRHEELSPQRIWTSPSGRTLVDFGQNLAGWIRVRLSGPAGTEITIRHAEVLEHEELGTRPLRSARATDTFVCSGEVEEVEPTFTFHGFRYAEVNGWPGELRPEDLTAVVVHSDLRRLGHFRCSDERVNQLHDNVVWSQKGNFLDLPTDCPQRDERLGWTGDIAAFVPTATFLFDVQGFLLDWMADVEAEASHNDGIVPFVVPDVLKYEAPRPGRDRNSTCLWSDAAVWVPWALWQGYGDLDVLERCYPTMTGHVRHVRGLLSENGLWDTGFQFADWLDPTAPPDDPFRAKADPGVVATACYYRSVDLLRQTAELLGRTDDAAEFGRLADDLRTAFQRHYVSDGVVTSDCPTVYALAICFGLLEPSDETAAGARLAELAAENDHRVATGFAGTPFVCDALTRTGHLDVAYRLLLQTENPSWLYPVTMGATTIWERWDSMLPDGTINPGQMTSFNHYAFGAVADWLHRVVGGLAPLEPGYRRVLVAPRPGGGLTSASTALETPRGRVEVAWELSGAEVQVDVTLPAGVTALAERPDGQREELTASTRLSWPA
ncbi:alpha-L-rhamnosidase [Desertihabitans aurantiacus]|uniref:alpha-L-rhamnosidase n=1 Tax=Desertihabitans aurantiacus TaxID=2282477 RepID=UPI001E56224A|nr:alpha-L-rhamnosidase [Desertihabitans aurantiacus]